MRGVLALLVLVAVPAPAAASPDTARVARVEQAFAEWLVPTERADRFRWIAVAARKEFPPDGGAPVATVDVVKGRCTVRSSKGDETIMCSGSPRNYTLRSDDFSMDHVASTAALESKTRRLTLKVRWSPTGGAVDGAWWEQRDCSGKTAVGAGGSRLAIATGRVFGLDLPVDDGGRDFAAMDFGAVASQC